MDFMSLPEFAKMRQFDQSGGALLPHFRSSVSYQRGRGLGGLLRGLFRRVTPLFKKPVVRKGLKTIGKAAATALLEAGQQALQDNGSFGQALKSTSKKQAQALIDQAQSQMTGSGPLKRRLTKPKRLSQFSPPVKKRRVQSRDIFDDL